ncbi:MFS general substrate transporter [Pseudovirgaria hyperparasitica]|uniref:MFS general substrate transporter n=1 Tax=Pseudovirgaria hyperparasitica TaxID=470096 RepID=A0A6A6WK17_9PEZI|nr:MFS general substrate transporter [Pseudovirgaria hyperparasitica]KAF2762527.1 MFS general substrate transporter [Pseudovirgaria hyperparasitica]
MTTTLTRSTTTSQTDLDAVKEKDDHHDSIDLEKAPSSAASSTHSPLPSRKYHGLSWFAVCAAVYSSAFLYGLDTTIVADIQSFAVEDFGDVEKLGWLGIGFALGSVATILSFGKAYGVFDVKWLFIASLVMFEAGSALCGGAPSMNALIVGRVWAGAGGAGMYLGALNIVAINTSNKERPLYTSLIGLFWGAGCILGPVIGGAFADSAATWRWAFYINLILFALVSPVLVFVLESYLPQPDKTLSQRLRNMDWLGVILNAAVYVLYTMPLTLGGTTWSWTEGRQITLYVVFFAALILFAVTQKYSIFTTPENRLFSVDFLKDRTMVLLYIATSCVASTMFIVIYYIPLYFSFVFGFSGVQSAVALLPFIVVAITSIMLNGALMPRFGYYQPWYIASFFFMTIGGALTYALVDVHTSKSTIYGFSVLMALGAGLAQQAAYSVAASKVELHRVPDAIGFINTSQIGSTVIALTITSAMF